MRFALALLPFLLAQEIDNPQYKAWAAQKPGSWVKLTAVTTQDEQKLIEMEMTLTLQSVDEKAVTIKRETKKTVPGKEPENEEKLTQFPAKFDAKALPTPTKEGDEELTVDSKKLKCHWAEREMEWKGAKVTTKEWRSDDIPGGTVRLETTKGDAVTVMKATAFEKK